ncbi:hypothetical protein SEA_OZZYJ_52 [Streptomyces phage OzzyJ]|nr:hypothetical protein SEA_OZZYJ_52 [Streptomyces phage OzzyJ]
MIEIEVVIIDGDEEIPYDPSKL